jgi:arginase
LPVSLSVLGVPSSAGAFAPGQELAPRALREAGLIEALRERGLDVTDVGDSPEWRWRPDPSRPLAQHAERVGETARETAARVREALAVSARVLVLGGDCTVGVGTVAAHVSERDRLGLVYFDLHPDLNTPDSVRPGALDWMGMAHMLAVDGVTEELSSIGPRRPLLEDDQVQFFSYGPEQTKPFEHEVLDRRRLARVPVDEVAADPEGAATRMLLEFGDRFDRLVVHFDVDVIDFTDAPLSEETGRNQGLSFDAALGALAVIVANERVTGLTVTELNPLHGDQEGRSIGRFVDRLADCLAPH